MNSKRNKNCIRFKSPGILPILYTANQSTVVCLSGVVLLGLLTLVNAITHDICREDSHLKGVPVALIVSSLPLPLMTLFFFFFFFGITAGLAP